MVNCSENGMYFVAKGSSHVPGTVSAGGFYTLVLPTHVTTVKFVIAYSSDNSGLIAMGELRVNTSITWRLLTNTPA